MKEKIIKILAISIFYGAVFFILLSGLQTIGAYIGIENDIRFFFLLCVLPAGVMVSGLHYFFRRLVLLENSLALQKMFTNETAFAFYQTTDFLKFAGDIPLFSLVEKYEGMASFLSAGKNFTLENYQEIFKKYSDLEYYKMDRMRPLYKQGLYEHLTSIDRALKSAFEYIGGTDTHNIRNETRYIIAKNALEKIEEFYDENSFIGFPWAADEYIDEIIENLHDASPYKLLLECVTIMIFKPYYYRSDLTNISDVNFEDFLPWRVKKNGALPDLRDLYLNEEQIEKIQKKQKV